MKKKLIPIIILAVLLLIVLSTLWFFHAHYLLMDSTVYPRDIQTLDLSGTALSEPDKLTELSRLKELDLRETGLTAGQYDKLHTALPKCRIQWSVPFQGRHYPQQTRHLTLTDLSEADIPMLAYLPELETVDATACTDYDALMQLCKTYPDVDVSYQVTVGSQQLSQDTEALVLGDGTAAQLENALAYLPRLKVVDASGCREYRTLAALRQRYPHCDIRYNVSISGIDWSFDTPTLMVKDPDPQQLMLALPWLPQVKTVTLEGTLPQTEQLHLLQQAFPDIRFIWDFQLCGVGVNSLDTKIDLSNIPMDSVSEVENALKYFYNLDRVIMCDCGISNEEMDALCQRNPQIRFVWAVDIGHRIHIRTDATYLMPFQYGTKLTDRDVENLKYCVDMICIDFGHSEVSDISFVAYMPHMKYLLLGDTEVSDISPCEGLQELEFVELFLTNVTDYSPLISCPNLRDLNICYALPDDVDDLCRITQLENLWMKGYWQPEGKQQLHQALPDANIVFSTPGNASATDNGWRELPNYFAMRDVLGMFYMKG